MKQILFIWQGDGEVLKADSLKEEMAKKGYTFETLANEIGVSKRTFSTRMKKGNFLREEIEIIIDKLELKNLSEIFFGK